MLALTWAVPKLKNMSYAKFARGVLCYGSRGRDNEHLKVCFLLLPPDLSSKMEFEVGITSFCCGICEFRRSTACRKCQGRPIGDDREGDSHKTYQMEQSRSRSDGIRGGKVCGAIDYCTTLEAYTGSSL